MESKDERAGFLDTLPPVKFGCIYGSSLHPNNTDKSTMVDYILGVADPLKWHTENLKMNRDNYGSWMVYLGGAKMITQVADEIGVGVHFNPFVTWNVFFVSSHVFSSFINLVQEVLLEWSLAKTCMSCLVCILKDNLNLENLNYVNLRAAASAALLLLPSDFTEEDLYAKIYSLSYTGDLRMLFAEGRNKVRKIVRGQFNLFQTMYKPSLEEHAAKDLLRFSSSNGNSANIIQVEYYVRE